MGEATSGFYSRGGPFMTGYHPTMISRILLRSSRLLAICDDAAVSGANYAPVELLVPSEIGERSSSAENKSSLA